MDHTQLGRGAAPAGVPGGVLSRERTVAGAHYNRWLAPPAALAIHLCIGMSYGFSVFWLPMTKLVPNADAAACSAQGFSAELFSASCNWSVLAVTHIFEIFIAMLGISAAIWGRWLEHAGPRKAGFVAACCWGGGLILMGFGVSIHQLWLMYVAAFVGGIGQGIGYITPVSTLIKWFPDRRGMATGFAIMGYGGGAMVGAPLAVWLMGHFGHDGIAGVSQTLVAMGVIYFIAMTAGAFGFRVAPSGWYPRGWTPPANDSAKGMITRQNVHLNKAWRTPQFWLIWGVLCLNVTAGIAVIAMASPMLQEVFGPKLLGLEAGTAMSAAQKAALVASAAGLVGLISLFNSLGRIFWASLSDKIGRKTMYFTIFVLGIALYGLLPTWGHLLQPALFVASICIIMSMYGGGFSTVPAYLADIFGPQMVGAIHGRLITAWSVAGVVGPTLIAGIRQFQIDHGVAHNLIYDVTLYIMAVLLAVGFLCNLFVKPVDKKYWMTEEELAHERALLHEDRTSGNAETAARGKFGVGSVLAWLAVGIPFATGLYIAIQKAVALF
ncbi:OFA family MFS transporter [Trinickia terrae]|uniref:OFA family MFS transporter n=1 Tax=Trinickia terrae TaxID=2571161 RepID=A0A4U1I0N6_9BURK|nr:OFA family MFS transporter [Trinickia terrae]TKC86672.1 OFA family MFS transporter [Trinickia terrae]